MYVLRDNVDAKMYIFLIHVMNIVYIFLIYARFQCTFQKSKLRIEKNNSHKYKDKYFTLVMTSSRFNIGKKEEEKNDTKDSFTNNFSQ